MSVISRTFRTTPHRDAKATWDAIVALLGRGTSSDAVSELNAVSGIASSVIVDGTPKQAPIIVTCDGPRTRIYCVYDDDALDESNANEDALGFDPLKGDWQVSLPCTTDDLDWVQRALRKHSARITARDSEEGIAVAASAAATGQGQSMAVNLEGLFK